MKALLMTYAQERPVQSEERPEDIYLDMLFDSIFPVALDKHLS